MLTNLVSNATAKRSVDEIEHTRNPNSKRNNRVFYTAHVGNNRFQMGNLSFQISLSKFDLNVALKQPDTVSFAGESTDEECEAFSQHVGQNELEVAKFVAKLACSFHDYHGNSKSMDATSPVFELDLERLKGKGAIEQAKAYFGDSVRYIRLMDFDLPICNVVRIPSSKCIDNIVGVNLILKHPTAKGVQRFFVRRANMFDCFPCIYHDRGIEHYTEMCMNMKVATFRGHFNAMSHNSQHLQPSNLEALLSINALLQTTTNKCTDTTLVKVALDKTLAPYAYTGPQATSCNEFSKKPVSAQTIVKGSDTYRMRLCTHVIRNAERGVEYGDPIADPLVDFVSRAALSIYNRAGRATNIYPINDNLDMRRTCKSVKRIDLRLLSDLPVLNQAQNLFGTSVRYIEFVDAVPPMCDVGYDMDGVVSTVELRCTSRTLAPDARRPFVLKLDELWNVNENTEEERGIIDRSFPEYKLVQDVISVRCPEFTRRPNFKSQSVVLQRMLEEMKPELFDQIARRRKHSQNLYDKPSGLGHLKTMCVETLEQRNVFDVMVFLWKYDMFISSDKKWCNWTTDISLSIASLILKLSRWLRIELEWVFGIERTLLQQSLRVQQQQDNAVQDTMPHTDASTDSSDSETAVDTESASIVDVLAGAMKTGKSQYCVRHGAKEVLSLFEYVAFKKRFPLNRAYLVLSCDSPGHMLSNVNAILTKQQFVVGKFNFRITYKQRSDIFITTDTQCASQTITYTSS